MRGSSARTVVVAVLLVFGFGFGCGGGCGGCGGMTPIPGGFPSEKRNDNAVQVRVSQSGLAAVAADPAALVSAALGGGPLEFSVPASCGGSPAVCCPGGNPVSPCGPLQIDLDARPGDLPRLELRPASGASRLDVTVRARLTTVMDIPVQIPLVGNCGLKIDTNAGTPDDVKIDLPINFVQDAQVGTTRIVAGDVAVTQLSGDDVALTGSLGCQLASLGTGFIVNLLVGTVEDQIASALGDATCKACATGDVAECSSPFATACTDGTCMKADDTCLQELGLNGRLAGLLPGTTGALDLYEVLGGYATTNNNGIALGMLGGMEPGGAPRDRCGPPATAPALVNISQSPFFTGNTRPDTGEPFGIAIGLHASQLTQFAYAGYDGGSLCLTVNNALTSQLNTDTISLVSRSIANLNEIGTPVAVGLRPQAPPVITLGKNTFMANGVVDDPLLRLVFTQLEIDFFAMVDDQYIRVMTLVTDFDLPIGMQATAMGELQPVLGDVSAAFTNLTVKNSEALTESPEALANLFPTLLGVILPQLSGVLPTVALPEIAGLKLEVKAITAVPTTPGGTTNDFMAIFADLSVAMAKPVQTTAELVSIEEPDADVLKSPETWSTATPPTFQLALGVDGASREAAYEYSIRLDRGTWTVWSTTANPVLAPKTFFLSGTHIVEVRAREVGKPETIDGSPVEMAITIGEVKAPISTIAFHGDPGESGCSCDAGGSPVDSAPMALVLGFVVLWRRRGRKPGSSSVKSARWSLRRPRLGAVVWATALACLPACSCADSPCGEADCLPGDLPTGSMGRYTSLAADQERVVVATYNSAYGDLVAVDVTDPANPKITFVDGVPQIPPTYAPTSYRGGIEDKGENVGAYTSIAMTNGLAAIAYHDRDARALKFAAETKQDTWAAHTVDAGGGEGEVVGRYTSVAFDSSGNPAIAYFVYGVDDGSGSRITQLRLARGKASSPKVAADWTTSTIVAGVGSCAGLCGSGACVATGVGQACITPSSDCPAACGDTEVCNAGTCVAELEAPSIEDTPMGVGLYPTLLALPDGRLAVVFYDRNARALVIAVDDGTGTFAPTILDSNATGDRGMFADAVVDGAGVVHVAYQDAVGDQLMYTTWNGAPGTPVVVDDGQRAGDRTHPVGAGAAIFLSNGAPSIAYQDGLVADVYVANQAGTTWTTTAVISGPILDGFSIGASAAYGSPYLAWDQLTPANEPPNALFVHTY